MVLRVIRVQRKPFVVPFPVTGMVRRVFAITLFVHGNARHNVSRFSNFVGASVPPSRLSAVIPYRVCSSEASWVIPLTVTQSVQDLDWSVGHEFFGFYKASSERREETDGREIQRPTWMKKGVLKECLARVLEWIRSFKWKERFLIALNAILYTL